MEKKSSFKQAEVTRKRTTDMWIDVFNAGLINLKVTKDLIFTAIVTREYSTKGYSELLLSLDILF